MLNHTRHARSILLFYACWDRKTGSHFSATDCLFLGNKRDGSAQLIKAEAFSDDVVMMPGKQAARFW